MKERILKMTNAGIFINDTESISIENTNLPTDDFSFVGEIYWKVAIELDNEKKNLIVDVLDYNSKNYTEFKKQKIQGEVPYMAFQRFKYSELIRQVACNKSGIMRSLCKDYPLGSKEPIDENIHEKKLRRKLHRNILPQEDIDFMLEGAVPYKTDIDSARQRIYPHNVRFKQKFSECTIKNGLVELTHKLPGLSNPVTIQIFNEHLKEQYDLVKEYISKRLGKKSFVVNAALEMKGYEVISYTAVSEEIEKINDSLIAQIRYRQIQSLARIDGKTLDKKLHSIEKVLKHSDHIKENVFDIDIDNIIKVLTDEYKYRNSKQILYLANVHNASEEKVYLTLKPYFGFVFYIKGTNKHHYIWELLDTHATYIWSFHDSSYIKEKAFDIVELAVNEIHAHGRNVYKTNFKINTANDFDFAPLEHELTENESKVVFETWKVNVENVISR